MHTHVLYVCYIYVCYMCAIYVCCTCAIYVCYMAIYIHVCVLMASPETVITIGHI